MLGYVSRTFPVLSFANGHKTEQKLHKLENQKAAKSFYFQIPTWEVQSEKLSFPFEKRSKMSCSRFNTDKCGVPTNMWWEGELVVRREDNPGSVKSEPPCFTWVPQVWGGGGLPALKCSVGPGEGRVAPHPRVNRSLSFGLSFASVTVLRHQSGSGLTTTAASVASHREQRRYRGNGRSSSHGPIPGTFSVAIARGGNIINR